MRLIAIITVFLTSLLIAGCLKKEDPAPVDNISNGSFTFAGSAFSGVTAKVTFIAPNVTLSGINCFQYTDNLGHNVSMAVYFKEYPTTAGTYRLVSKIDSNTVENDVALINLVDARTGSEGKLYTSYNSEQISVDLDVQSVKATIPEVKLRYFEDTTVNTTFSAKLRRVK